MLQKRTEAGKLGAVLLANRLITESQLVEAIELQKTVLKPLGRVLIDKGWLTERRLLQALAAQIGVSAWYLEEDSPDLRLAGLVPIEVCRAHYLIPLRRQGNLLTLGMVQPHDTEAIDLVRTLTGNRIEPALVDPRLLAERLDQLEEQVVSNRMHGVEELVREAVEGFGEDHARLAERPDLDEADSRPVVELVNQIIATAIARQASDVHLEPRLDRVEVRFRIDGELVGAMDVPARLAPALTTRVKIMAEMDIVEYRLPQDGHITVEVKNREVNLRVSSIPTRYGQRIVMRVLDKAMSLRPLPRLGFDPDALALFEGMIHRPHGLVLVTGPTGSGKTTTLYSALARVRTGRNNVMTCEDPIEYDVDGVNQSQVNEKVGLTFAAQLRAILRQDPDVVLVGEIRDRETAETALRASMTGHLVFSTLHTNDAPSAVPRMLDIGVDPYLLSTSLVGVTAQRLVRLCCPRCRVEGGGTAGCSTCQETGFRGRRAVHEALPVTEEVRRLIAARAPVDEIAAAGARAGYRRMLEPALRLAQSGETTLEEVRRVIGLDPYQGGEGLSLAA